MVMEEGSRRRLYSHLVELLGDEDTETLMGYLPPTGWAEMATKRDLDQLAQTIRGELAVFEARVEARLDSLKAHLETGLATQEARLEAGLARAALDTRSSLRTLFLGLVGLQMSGAALAVAVARAA